jgi:transcriptional regulator with XRE-family HTH domain
MKYKTIARTPGGIRLKALREACGRTQLDIELDASLGIGYLQRLEAGKVQQPERETLERILTALGTRYIERCEILKLFGYTVDAPIPYETDIRWAVEACRADLEQAAFPAYLLDCHHRLLAWNAFVPKLFPPDTFLRRRADYLSIPKVIFDPAYRVTTSIMNADVFFPAQIRVLHYEKQWLGDETWHNIFIDEMLQYQTFRKYWVTYKPETTLIAARPLTPLIFNLGEQRVQFRLVSEPFVQDQRFRVIYYLPADADTIQQCRDWSH